MRTTASAFLALLLVLAGSGCSDEPNGVGAGLLPGSDSLRVSTAEVRATGDTTFLRRIRGSSTTLLLGSDQGVQARTLLLFAGLSLVPSSATLDSAVLRLRIVYHFKDSSGFAGIEAHRFTRPFTAENFTWDTTTAAGAYSDTVSGSLLQSITPADTLIAVRIDTALIRQWMQTDNGSMILLPTGNTVIGIGNTTSATADTRALLTVSYHDSADTTITLARAATLGAFVADGTFPMPSDRVVLQSGVVTRGIIRFDSLPIPRQASITQAFLELPIDTAASLLNSYSNDNLIVYLLRGTTAPWDSVALGTAGTPVTENGQKFYRAGVKSTVQQWLTRQPNLGIVVRATGEFNTLDRFVLYGAEAAPGLRPRLKITYTVLP